MSVSALLSRSRLLKWRIYWRALEISSSLPPPSTVWVYMSGYPVIIIEWNPFNLDMQNRYLISETSRVIMCTRVCFCCEKSYRWCAHFRSVLLCICLVLHALYEFPLSCTHFHPFALHRMHCGIYYTGTAGSDATLWVWPATWTPGESGDAHILHEWQSVGPP
jgi:hypothetical protein